MRPGRGDEVIGAVFNLAAERPNTVITSPTEMSVSQAHQQRPVPRARHCPIGHGMRQKAPVSAHMTLHDKTGKRKPGAGGQASVGVLRILDQEDVDLTWAVHPGDQFAFDVGRFARAGDQRNAAGQFGIRHAL